MRRPTPSELVGWACALAGALASSGAAAADPAAALRAALTCRPEAAPGRVLCELKYTAPAGERLVWADALVTQAPDFVRPLRSRVSPGRFAGASTVERKLSLAFVASHNGVGTVTVRARAVICRGRAPDEACRPASRDVVAEIRVGS